VIAPFADLPAEATAIAGGKGASLARMAGAGLPVPRGFVVCTAAFQSFLERHGAREFVLALMERLDVHDTAALNTVSDQVRAIIVGNPLPEELNAVIRAAYADLGPQIPVAVRSSAVGEDGEAASFAGQQETFLNVRGDDAVARDVRECWASYFAPRALFYRAQKGTLSDMRMAVVVQEMVLAEKSGVLFTMDPIRKRRDHMVIEAVFGLGEGVVSGMITPDHYVVDRKSGAVVNEFISVQSIAVLHDVDHGGTRHVELSEAEGGERVLGVEELQDLRTTGLRVEAFLGSPQDIEWSYRGGELLLLQSRPITTL
jgi:phosphoenolpyruvate synthase/pyruvate phosphate dikinase